MKVKDDTRLISLCEQVKAAELRLRKADARHDALNNTAEQRAAAWRAIRRHADEIMRLTDLVDATKPLSMAGFLAKVELAHFHALDGGESGEPQSNGVNDQLAFAVVRDIVAGLPFLSATEAVPVARAPLIAAPGQGGAPPQPRRAGE